MNPTKKDRATLSPEPIFTMHLNGKAFTGLRVVSEWEGFKKLERGDEFVILATSKAGGPFAEAFGAMFGDLLREGQSAEYIPVVASAALGRLISDAIKATT